MLLPRQRLKLTRGVKAKEHAMSQTVNAAIAVVGIDIGKNSFHIVGHERGAIVWPLEVSPLTRLHAR